LEAAGHHDRFDVLPDLGNQGGGELFSTSPLDQVECDGSACVGRDLAAYPCSGKRQKGDVVRLAPALRNDGRADARVVLDYPAKVTLFLSRTAVLININCEREPLRGCERVEGLLLDRPRENPAFSF